MPELCAFLSCERVIIDKETGQLSLVSILQGVNVPLPSKEIPPIGSLAPFQWAALAIWTYAATEEVKPLEQRVTLFAEDGTELIQTVAQLPSPKHDERTGVRLNSQIINRFAGFPIWAPGLCRLQLQIRQVGESTWTDVSKFYILVTFNAPPET